MIIKPYSIASIIYLTLSTSALAANGAGNPKFDSVTVNPIPNTSTPPVSLPNGYMWTTPNGMYYQYNGVPGRMGHQILEPSSYGAICDGNSHPLSATYQTLGQAQIKFPTATSLDEELDDAAINTMMLVASVGAYQNHSAVSMYGLRGSTTRECQINQLNFTRFNVGAGSTDEAQVLFEEFDLFCTGATNNCMDGAGADILTFRDMSLRGDATPGKVPRRGISLGVINDTQSSAWHHFDGIHVDGNYTKCAMCNVGSEDNHTLPNSFIVNGQGPSTVGPIGSWGSVTQSNSGTDGNYTTNLLGSVSGQNSAIATINVTGGTATVTTVSYPGDDYAAGETLSPVAPIAGITTLTIPLVTVKPYALMLDAYNHTRISSSFATITTTPDVWHSSTLFTTAANIRSAAGGVWIAGFGGPLFDHNYILVAGTSCVDMWSQFSNTGPQQWSYQFYMNCEGANTTSVFYSTGPNTTPVNNGFVWNGYSRTKAVVFDTDPGITNDFPGANITLAYSSPRLPMFSKPSAYCISGSVYVYDPFQWNPPNCSSVRLTVADNNIGLNGLSPNLIRGNAVLELSCSRKVDTTYNGPLCGFLTATGIAFDIYPDSNGIFDRNAYNSICAPTTCKVVTMYDQSSFHSTCTQSNPSNQPSMQIADSNLGYRDVVSFGGELGALAITCTAASGINNIFNSTNLGYMSIVIDQNVVTHSANRLFTKANGNGGSDPGEGYDFRIAPNATPTSSYPFTFNYGAQTSNLLTTTLDAPITNTGHVYTIKYSAASLSNAPAFKIDNILQNQTTRAPVGTLPLPSDAPYDLIIGNNNGSIGNRSCACDIAEIIAYKNIPSASLTPAFETSMTTNQANFYKIPIQ